MLQIVTNKRDLGALSKQLLHIKFTAKLEGYEELYPLLDEFIELNRDVHNDFLKHKYDNIIRDHDSFDKLDYYLLESFNFYWAEQLIGEFIFRAINQLEDDDLFDLGIGLLYFLSDHHRAIYQYMAGKGYIQIIEDKFS